MSPTSCSSAPNFRRAVSTPTGANGRRREETWFPGYSIGKWRDTDGDGRFDTLEVETRHVRGPRVWDQSGMPMADDDEGVITERIFSDKADPDLLRVEMTTVDNSLTRPWTVTKTFKRRTKVWWAQRQLHRGPGPRHHRQGGLFPQRRRHADADEKGPAAAGPEVLQAGAEVTRETPATASFRADGAASIMRRGPSSKRHSGAAAGGTRNPEGVAKRTGFRVRAPRAPE